MEDLNAIIDSNILANVASVFSDTARNTKKEALNTICDIIVKLAHENELQKLRDVFVAYSLETILIQVLRRDTNNPMNQYFALLTYETLL